MVQSDHGSQRGATRVPWIIHEARVEYAYRMLVLGIDTSCDDTAAAVLETPRHVRSNVIASQHDLHAAFGGVVPEIASRAHAERMTWIIDRALSDANATMGDIDLIAVTNRPGLIGSLMVGVAAAKSLAWVHDIPILGVHHIEAHCVSAMADVPTLSFPFLSLVASGGHTAIYACHDPTTVVLVSSTIDDAAGECFDKVAVMLGLSQPGGPAISRLAETGNPKAVRFPRARVKRRPLDFSFSGVKTSVLYFLKGPGGKRNAPTRDDLECSYADVAASFQRAVVDVLCDRTLNAAEQLGISDVAIGGGVAANNELRRLLAERAPEHLRVHVPSMPLCCDNGAMIALRGAQLYEAGQRGDLEIDVFASSPDGAG